MTFFTKESFFEFTKEYNLPPLLQEKFWETRPNGSDMLDEEVIRYNASVLAEEFKKCENCEDKETCAMFTAKTPEDLKETVENSLFPPHTLN